MSVGTAAGIAIAAGASAAASTAAAKIQSNAAKKAAQIQSASADKAMAQQGDLSRQALGLQGQMFGGIQQMYSPYTQSAPASLSALHEYLGIPGAAQSQTMVPYGAYGPPMRQPFLGQPGAGGPPIGRPNVPGPQFGGGVGPYAASMQGGPPMGGPGMARPPMMGGQVPMSQLFQQMQQARPRAPMPMGQG
jgi:hypothetical protein